MDLDALAFGAHADDVEITCGGTMIKLASLGYKTGVVGLTRGEMATRGTPEIRAAEFKTVGRDHGLGHAQDARYSRRRVEVTWENKLKIIAEIRAHKPRIVFAPYWVERHPDHEKTSHLVRESAYLAGLEKNRDGAGGLSAAGGSFFTRAGSSSRLRSSSIRRASTTER